MDSPVIGIVGGGQLGRMLTLAAKPLGFDVLVLDPKPNCPAAQVGARQIEADLYDEKALAELASKCDFLTFEIEHLNADYLATLKNKHIQPLPATVKLIQDKYEQKRFWQEKGIPQAEFMEIGDAEATFDQLGGKMIIKAREQSFDGRGNALVTDKVQIADVIAKFDGRKLYAEKVVDFEKELAVVLVRDVKGNIKLYPVVETVHERNICTEVIAPARVDKAITQKATTLAEKVAAALEGAGVFAVEMFLTKDGEVLLNEVAPRVHNSGHYTIEACRTSQFENHIRAITGMPLGSTEMIVHGAVMVNILGERDGEVKLEGLDKARAIEGVSVHLYGKSPVAVDRKMGHVTATADTVELALDKARRARGEISL